jgi:uncharacterized coiled-coil DUF342 family protein
MKSSTKAEELQKQVDEMREKLEALSKRLEALRSHIIGPSRWEDIGG